MAHTKIKISNRMSHILHIILIYHIYCIPKLNTPHIYRELKLLIDPSQYLDAHKQDLQELSTYE